MKLIDDDGTAAFTEDDTSTSKTIIRGDNIMQYSMVDTSQDADKAALAMGMNASKGQASSPDTLAVPPFFSSSL
jgi:hypothetical protein